MRISEFIKKHSTNPSEDEKKAAPPFPVHDIPGQKDGSFRPGMNLPHRFAETEHEAESVNLSLPTDQELEERKEKSREAEAIYNEALVFIKLLFSHLNQATELGYKNAENLIRRISSFHDSSSSSLMLLALEETPKNYLIAHSVNAAILALKIAKSYGIMDSTLLHTGLAALLHDLGMGGYFDLIYQKKILTEEEKKTIRLHSRACCDIIERFSDIPQNTRKTVTDIIIQVHERKNAQGYPSALKDVLVEAQIIGVVDIFEAMTHQRAYRKKIPPFKAIETIIKEEQDAFDPRVIKCVIEELSIYPVGSIVRLDNNLLAEVIATNREYPVRPVVRIVFNNTQVTATNIADLRLVKGTIIDLSKNSMFYIKEGVDNWEEGNQKAEVT